jgi:hypothetical protein
VAVEAEDAAFVVKMVVVENSEATARGGWHWATLR